MRSDLVFLAGRHVTNRFLLCHWIRVASRRFHKNGEPIQATISKVLAMVQASDAVRHLKVGEDSVVVTTPVKAAVASIARMPAEPVRNVG